MKNLQDLLEQIKLLEKELYEEIQKKQEEYYYIIRGKKVRFEKAARRQHKALVTHIHTYLWHSKVRNIVSVPFIWACLPPALFMDLVLSVFQAISFTLYRIPKVKRSEYIIIDRHSLAYLNVIEKINCVYCGYFSGVIAYVQEIAARTEQYWCPIKHARRVGNIHSRYNKFMEYGDAKKYKEGLGKIRNDFKDLTNKN
ncbi:MAG: hypothetical protein ABFQ82_04910 [Thermodesulfobacteriota bacterium]